MISRGFVDVLFILLCGTIALLSQSVRLGAIDAAPARAGGGGVSPIHADQIRSLIVSDKKLALDGDPLQIDEVADRLKPAEIVLLLPSMDTLSHHRMIAVWSELRERGVEARFGVQSTGDFTNESGRSGKGG